MLTETIISILKNDSALRTLLGASSANTAPIQASFARNKVESYLIGVEVVMGESNEVDFENGALTIEVMVGPSIDAPISKIEAIMKRIIACLDLKGSQLNSATSPHVYRLRKLNSGLDFDQDYQCHVGNITFEFYTNRSV